MYGPEARDVRGGAELRYDEPRGACDVFGIGVMLAEMLYGVSEKSLEGFRQWEKLLFPSSLSPASVKESVVNAIDMSRHGESEAAKNLQEIMIERCRDLDLFFPIISYALEQLGAAALLLRVLSYSGASRLSPRDAYEHAFFRREVNEPPDTQFVTPPSHAIRIRDQREFDQFDMSSTPFTMKSFDLSSAKPTKTPSFMSVTERINQQMNHRHETVGNSSCQWPIPSSMPSSTSLTPVIPAMSLSPMSPMSPLPTTTKAKAQPSINELQSRIQTLKECNQRKKTQLRESLICKLEEGVSILQAGGTWVESEPEDDY